MNNNENTGKSPKNFKKFKYGTMSVVVIVLVIAIVVVINVIAGIVMKRYPLKLDLTADKRFELCDETIDALKKLDKDVEITVTYPKEVLLQYNYYQMVPEILDKYSVYAKAGSGNIDVNYIDVNKDPDLVAKYKKNYNGDINEGQIVIASGEQVKVSPVVALFNQASDGSITFMGESAITSAIMSVTDANPVNAVFLSMMGDSYVYGNDASAHYCIQSFKNLIASNGYECTEADIMNADISTENCDLIAIPAPIYDYSEDVISKLEDFLYNDGMYGKNVIYIANLYATDLPNLEEFLAKWNIQMEDAVIYDDNASMNASLFISKDPVSAPILSIADAEAVGTLPNENLPVVAPMARQLSILDKNSEYVTSSVLTSSNTSYLLPLTEDTKVEEGNGPRDVMVLSKRERAEQFDVYTSNVLAVGSAYMADPLLISSTNAYNNANLLLNSVNTMTGKENSFVIPQKELQRQTLALDSSQLKVIGNVVIYVIPLLVVAAGVIVFVRRRNR